jgi:hypothetical protein
MTNHAPATGATLVVLLIAAAMVWPAFGEQAPPDELATIPFTPFSKSAWGFTPGREYPGAKGHIEKAVDVERGREILRLHYDFTEGGAYVGTRGNFVSTGRARALLLEVKAPRGASIFFRFFDKTGQVFQKVQPAEADGWQSYRVELGPPWQVIFGGSGSKRMHWPMQAVLLGVNKGSLTEGSIEFANLKVESLPPTPEQVRVERQQHAFTEQQPQWRNLWLDCLDRATAVENLLDRSVRLTSWTFAKCSFVV